MMKTVNIDNVIRTILDSITANLGEQFTLSDLKQILYMTLSKYNISEECTALSVDIDCTEQYVQDYLLNMKLNGCTEKSINAYRNDIKNMLIFTDKPVTEITYHDLRNWLGYGKIVRKWKDRTYNTKLVEMRGFFSWLYEEDLLPNNPAKKLKETKVEHRIGLTLQPEEREEIRCQCKNERELAICDFLYSSGVRISELCSLNITDINFTKKSAIVYGKGRKEREIYFNAQTKVHLVRYLKERTDDNPALFVSERKPYNRVTSGSIRTLLDKIKNRNDATKGLRLTPHVFRRTVGTDMINKGAPIELVAEKLGHKNISTTKDCYCSIARETVRQANDKFVS